ncbi:DASH complex subunit Spc19 [Cercophora scortea]|uniref:DASH complex subunit SPC19 n=1 Tax=Cercophora scortea TaxID=314031 RepID=A0AAE0J6E4_9PEZI|nr:DASH complex subunit Spc19 [Cercophora scortea]
MASSTSASSYRDCVSSLRTSLSFLESSVATLGHGVEDFPRLATVLKTVRHYELIPQPTLAAAESSLRDEIGPFIALLLDRADKQLERQQRRIETLKARADLNAGRLSHYPTDDEYARTKEAKHRHAAALKNKNAKAKTLDGGAALRAKVVHQRKEALKYSVERLELEVQQKERELRVRLEQRGA